MIWGICFHIFVINMFIFYCNFDSILSQPPPVTTLFVFLLYIGGSANLKFEAGIVVYILINHSWVLLVCDGSDPAMPCKMI